MKTQTVTLSSQTFSAWLPMDTAKSAFNVDVGVVITPAAVLTYSVQHTHNDIFKRQNPKSIVRSTTTVTVNLPNHGLSVGDYVRVEGGNFVSTDQFDGEFAVAAITDANNFTYTVTNTGATTAQSQARVVVANVVASATLAAKSASADGSYTVPVRAIRLIITAFTSGAATMFVNQGSGF